MKGLNDIVMKDETNKANGKANKQIFLWNKIRLKK